MNPDDNEAPSWNELLENVLSRYAVQNTTVLIAPHHGREAGFCPELLDLMDPRLVVISDGEACDTSGTGQYSDKASGCRVKNGIGTAETRKCLTTRTDGHITLSFGLNNNEPAFWVSTSRPAVAPPSFLSLMEALLKTQR